MAPNLFKLNIEDVEALRQVGKQARELLLNTPFPDDLNAAIATSYQTLSQQYGDTTDLEVRSSAIVTNQGGRTCHAEFVAREIGIPAIEDCGNATDRLQAGIPVTLSCCH
jgi:phosphoenolpyruvate synthase/pyruvate phosphate dikinase